MYLRRLMATILASLFLGSIGVIPGHGPASSPDLPHVKTLSQPSANPVKETAQEETRQETPSPSPEDAPGSEAETGLPWDTDPRLEAAKSLYGTPVLMASYRATLHDPLPGEGYNIGHAANMLAGTVVWPGQIFSQNKSIGPYTKARGYRDGPMYAGTQIVTSEGGGVCKIASVLYNVVTLSDLRVVERHAHSMTVPYVPPGQDATVAFGSFDFKFQNTTAGPILIWSAMVGKTLYIAFYGREKPPVVTWHHETIKRSNFTTVRRYNPSLPPGTETELVPGQEGIVVRSWLTIESADGKITRRNLGTDCYEPGPRVVEYGPAGNQ